MLLRSDKVSTYMMAHSLKMNRRRTRRPVANLNLKTRKFGSCVQLIINSGLAQVKWRDSRLRRYSAYMYKSTHLMEQQLTRLAVTCRRQQVLA